MILWLQSTNRNFPLVAQTGVFRFGWAIRASKNAVSPEREHLLVHLSEPWLSLEDDVGSGVAFMTSAKPNLIKCVKEALHKGHNYANNIVLLCVYVFRRWHLRVSMLCPMTTSPERSWSDAMPTSTEASVTAAFSQQWALIQDFTDSSKCYRTLKKFFGFAIKPWFIYFFSSLVEIVEELKKKPNEWNLKTIWDVLGDFDQSQ